MIPYKGSARIEPQLGSRRKSLRSACSTPYAV